eukprot:CAMPEP_0175120974 /NCGR_PEP_ID=MMETSP0087-20121206/911_1 /TAXON_ID=136419 /ORGANISM="Unknown Unknown, Strain D1" /LENGTH=354 /DNA_ID=CAMNT_0016402465 /DNA_START=87 /DNA_END=1148 /DNA_ORIENTATION=+
MDPIPYSAWLLVLIRQLHLQGQVTDEQRRQLKAILLDTTQNPQMIISFQQYVASSDSLVDALLQLLDRPCVVNSDYFSDADEDTDCNENRQWQLQPLSDDYEDEEEPIDSSNKVSPVGWQQEDSDQDFLDSNELPVMEEKEFNSQDEDLSEEYLEEDYQVEQAPQHAVRQVQYGQSEQKQPSPTNPLHVSNIELVQIRTAVLQIGFDELDLKALWEAFESYADGDGLPRSAYHECVEKAVAFAADSAAAQNFFSLLFVFLDIQNEGRIDLPQLLSGLCLFCRASRQEKQQFSFCILDPDGGAALSQDTAFRFMFSFCAVLSAMVLSVSTRARIRAEDLTREHQELVWNRTQVMF